MSAAVAGGAVAAVIGADKSQNDSAALYAGSVSALIFRLMLSTVLVVSFAYWLSTSSQLAESIQGICQSSPADQGCTPDGGVSANRADDNSTGGVTTPEVTWRASGSHSHGGANE